MAPSRESLVGKTIGGYEILELVGEGGMGAVYRARQLSLDREVAFKLLAPRLADNEEFVARFKREARSIAKVNHPNILQVHDVASADGLHFIAMEFIHGTNLSAKLKDKGFLEWRECADYIRQAALGLASAAKADIIHRDIKPDNLMITEDGVVKVSDFGLAKELSSGELTQTGDLMGTPAYMSPEQCDGDRLDTRTDIYSLGAAFYRAVTGVLPFNAPTPVAMMYKHKHEPLIPPKQYMPNLPMPVNRIIEHMMSKTPPERFSSMDEVAEALRLALQDGEAADIDSTLKLSVGRTPPPPAPPPPAAAAAPSPAAPAAPFAAPFGNFDAAPAGPVGGTDGDLTYEQLIDLGDRHAQSGHVLAACDCWKRALNLRPGDAAAKQRLERTKKESNAACLSIGEGLLEQGKLSAQRAELTRILQVDPENVQAREKLAALDFMEQKRRASLLEIRKLLSSGEQEKSLALWESLHPTLRDKALAPTMDNLKIRVLPCQRLAKEAKTLSQKGQFEEAFAKWDEAIQLDPTNDRVKLGRQETQRYYERMETALRDGYEYNVKRQYEAAIQSFEQVLQIDPDHAQAHRYITEALTELARTVESHHDYEAAVQRWKQVLERKPGDKAAMERLENATRQRNALHGHIENGQEALRRGRYSRARSQFLKALAIQPDNKTAVYGVEEASSRRFKRRIVPLLILLLIGLGVGGVLLHVRFQQNLEEGDAKFNMARVESPNRTDEYARAIDQWNRARKLPVIGWLRTGQIQKRIARARAYTELDREEKTYEERDLAKLQENRENLLALLEAQAAALGTTEEQAGRFRAEWHIAHLLARSKAYGKSKVAYDRALKIAEENEGVHFEVKQDNIRRAVNNYLDAMRILADTTLDQREREKRAAQAADDAYKQWSELKEAEALRDRLRSKHGTITEKFRLASKLIDAGRTAMSAGQRKNAMAQFDQAREAARAVLELQHNHWGAKKIVAEVDWREEAGQDMAFFVYPYADDVKMDRKFRAFALDHYEWPNRKGTQPDRMSFKQAIEAAKAVGKDLPYMDEWLFAAQGEKQDRIWSYGNEYSENKGNTGNKRMNAWPAGSRIEACTPEGIYDMTGNVAEWVMDRRRNVYASEQYTAGGHFGSQRNDCRNDAFQPRKANLRHADVGFRAAKRWEIKRQP